MGIDLIRKTVIYYISVSGKLWVTLGLAVILKVKLESNQFSVRHQ